MPFGPHDRRDFLAFSAWAALARTTHCAARAEPAAESPPLLPSDPADPWELPPGVRRLGRPEFRHPGIVQFLAFSPDHRYLLTADSLHYSIWNVADGRRLGRFPQPEVGYLAHHFPGDGTVEIITHGSTIHHYALQGGVPLSPRSPALPPTPHMNIAPDGQAVAFARPRTVEMYNLTTGALLWKMPYDGREEDGIAEFSPNGQLLAVPAPGRFLIYQTHTGALLQDLRGPNSAAPPDAALFSADSEWLVAIASNWPGLWAWRLRDGKVRHLPRATTIPRPIFGPEPGTIRALYALEEERGHEFALWELRTGERSRWTGPLSQLLADQHGMLRASSHHQKWLATADHSLIRLWDVATGQELPQSPEEIGPIQGLREGFPNRILSFTEDFHWRSWNLTTGTHRREPMLPAGVIEPPTPLLALAPDLSASIATLTEDGYQVRLAGVEEPVLLPRPKGWSDESLLIFPDDSRWLVGLSDRIVCRWNRLTQTFDSLRLEGGGIAQGVAVDRSGETVLAGYFLSEQEWQIRIVRMTERREVGQRTFDGMVGTFDISSDGRVIMAIRVDMAMDRFDQEVHDQLTLELLDGPNWSRRRSCRYNTPQETVRRNPPISFSMDGRVIAGAVKSQVVGWEVLTGQRRFTLSHEGSVAALTFQGQGRYLASAVPEGPIFYWDLHDPKARHFPTRRNQSSLMASLGSDDAVEGFAAIRELLQQPAATIAWLRSQVPPARSHDPRAIRDLVAKLDSPRPTERDRATAELVRLADRNRPQLAELMAQARTAESIARLDEILRRNNRPDEATRRAVRGMEVLEILADPQGDELLATWARGAASAWQTEEAQATIRRRQIPQNANI